jgi:hypothetical protein
VCAQRAFVFAGELHLLRMASLVWPQPDQWLSRDGSASIPTAARGYSNQPLPFALSAIWFRVQSRECNAEAAEAATSRPSWPGTFFTSITAFRFVRELVAFPPVLTGLYDEITDKANARGWCGYRPLAPPSLPLRAAVWRPCSPRGPPQRRGDHRNRMGRERRQCRSSQIRRPVN